MINQNIEANVDKIRDLCRETLRALRSESEALQYGAAIEQAAARRQLCRQVYEAWYESLSKRAKFAFRAAGHGAWNEWDGDLLSRLTVIDLRMVPNVGKKTVAEIVDSLRALGIEVPFSTRGGLVVFPPPPPAAEDPLTPPPGA
jgi:hypothetical protein